MVVDDNEDLLYIFKTFLSKQGFIVKVSHSCEQALNIISSFLPDIIFLDINLGDDDGRQVCLKIKAIAQFLHTPVILISAIANESSSSQEYKASGFLAKPLSYPAILQTIAAHT